LESGRLYLSPDPFVNCLVDDIVARGAVGNCGSHVCRDS